VRLRRARCRPDAAHSLRAKSLDFEQTNHAPARVGKEDRDIEPKPLYHHELAACRDQDILDDRDDGFREMVLGVDDQGLSYCHVAMFMSFFANS
jgi:hypothetical protein